MSEQRGLAPECIAQANLRLFAESQAERDRLRAALVRCARWMNERVGNTWEAHDAADPTLWDELKSLGIPPFAGAAAPNKLETVQQNKLNAAYPIDDSAAHAKRNERSDEADLKADKVGISRPSGEPIRDRVLTENIRGRVSDETSAECNHDGYRKCWKCGKSLVIDCHECGAAQNGEGGL